MLVCADFGPAHAADLSKAEDLYLTKCTKCHKLRDPLDYDDEEWAAWMTKMKKKARLNNEQYDLISKYTKLLRKTKTEGSQWAGK